MLGDGIGCGFDRPPELPLNDVGGFGLGFVLAPDPRISLLLILRLLSIKC